MTMITPSYLGETIEYSSLHACRSTLEDPTAVGESGRPHRVHRYREVYQSPARSETPCAYVDTSLGNREIPSSPKAAVAVGRVGKSKDVRR